MHLIDAKKTALVEGLRLAPWERGQGVACLRPRFCSQLGRRQRSGVKVAQPSRDDQRDPQELKKYRLNTKQVRRTKGLGVFPQAQPVTRVLSLPVLPSGSPALGLPVFTQTLLPRGSQTAPDSQLPTVGPYFWRPKSSGA